MATHLIPEIIGRKHSTYSSSSSPALLLDSVGWPSSTAAARSFTCISSDIFAVGIVRMFNYYYHRIVIVTNEEPHSIAPIVFVHPLDPLLATADSCHHHWLAGIQVATNRIV